MFGAAQSVGTLLTGLENDKAAQRQNQLSAYQQTQLDGLSGLQQAAPLASCIAQNLYNAYGGPPPPPLTSDWEWGRARFYAEGCEKLINRLLFWAALSGVPIFGVFAEYIANRLAARVEEEMDEIERWIGIARKIDAATASGRPE